MSKAQEMCEKSKNHNYETILKIIEQHVSSGITQIETSDYYDIAYNKIETCLWCVELGRFAVLEYTLDPNTIGKLEANGFKVEIASKIEQHIKTIPAVYKKETWLCFSKNVLVSPEKRESVDVELKTYKISWCCDA